MRELVVDNFAGGGGASLGIGRALGIPVDIAINHDREAIEMYRLNHPDTKCLCEDIWKVNPVDATGGRPVGLAWFSPDCTHFSRAKGGKPVEKKIRGLAWVVVRWAKAVRPRIIILENVAEFQEWGPLTKKNKPNLKLKGKIFNYWLNILTGLGYQVQWRELVAADYGAPTIRKRLFLIARCDGQSIVWPEKTHGTGLLPYRAAAECIDWSILCPSIFERKRPLAENTLRRIAKGIQKFVIEAKEPFIVRSGHYSNITGEGSHFRGQDIKKPLGTITSKNDKALIVPYLSGIDHQGSNGGCVWSADDALRTITKENRFALVAAFLSKYHLQKAGESRCQTPGKPIATLDTSNRFALVTSHLTKFYGTNKGGGGDMRNPMPTITGLGQHIGEVRAFLVKYYGTNIGSNLKKPMHTVTGKHRFGLVTVEGQQYQIADIGLRMLTSRELARAQGFPDSYILTGTKSNQVAKIGNSVCPVLAEVLVRANVKLQKFSKNYVA
ncbi:MAG: DNA cytosine methyltransferase [Sedimentisphaerales bacterium]